MMDRQGYLIIFLIRFLYIYNPLFVRNIIGNDHSLWEHEYQHKCTRVRYFLLTQNYIT